MPASEALKKWRKPLEEAPSCPERPETRVLEQAATYLELLSTWNEKVNLTSIEDPGTAAERLFWEAAPPLAYVPPGHLLDIGAGAGFPGIPLKILQPDLEITLLEPRRKRAVFLREALQTCGLERIHVLESRLEDVEKEGLEYDSFVWRAIKVSLRDLEPLLSGRPPHRALAWSTVEVGRQLEESSPQTWDTLHWVRLHPSRDRVVVVLEHIAAKEDG